MPKVSVLVPIFNVEKYLEQCLDSIVNQTLEDIEIICINDGSTDGSLKIIKRYAKKDPRIVIIDKKNSGYGDSMNKGLEKATGDYIGIVESDDWIELDAFEKLYELGIENDAEVVKSNFWNYFTTDNTKDELIKVIDPNDSGHLIDTYKGHSIMWQQPCIWSAIYKRTFLEQYSIRFLPSPGASYQDTGFNFKVWACAKKAYFINDAFLHYRQDNLNSSINSPGKVYCVADEYEEIEKFLRKWNRYDDLKDIFFSTRWGGYRWNIGRLTPDLASDFINYTSKQYKKAVSNGDFVYAFFDINNSREIKEIIYNPKLAIMRKKASSLAKVSIIVPVYNVEKYLAACMDSLVTQSFKDIEIVAIDDGSTDNSAEILEKYYSEDRRIKIANTTNRGLSAARNTGIKLAAADLIMFCDSDDYYNNDSVNTLYNSLTQNNVDIATGSVNVLYEGVERTAIEKHGDQQYYTTKLHGTFDSSDKVLKKLDVNVWSKIFKKSILMDNDIWFPEGLKFEDAYFTTAYMWSCKSIYFIEQDHIVYNYLRRPDSIMSRIYQKSVYTYDHTEIAEKLFIFLKRHDLFIQHKDYFVDFFKEYLNLTLHHTSSEHHEYTYNRARHFIESNEKFLSSVSPETYRKLLSMTSFKKTNTDNHNKTQDPPSTSLTKRSKDTSKAILRKVLPKFSVSYRSQKRLTSEIHSLRERIDSLEKHQDTTLQKSAKDIYKKLDEIARRIP